MPDLRQLHELAGQVRTPDLAELAVVADGRRRRAAATLGGAVAAALVVVALVAGNLSGNRGAAPLPVGPGPQTSSTVTTPQPDASTSYPALSPEAIRRHPTATLDPDSMIATTAARTVAARVWTACLGDCSRATEYVPGEVQKVLEVTHDDFTTSSLYVLDGTGEAAHVVDDWFFTEVFEGPQLVNSRGQRRPLTYDVPIPVAEVSGPVVHTGQGAASVDMDTRTVRPLQRDDDDQTWEWGGAGDSWYWGTVVLVDNGPVTRHAVLWRGADGTFATKVLPVPESEGGPGMLIAGRAGTMAVVEHFAWPRLVHISTDYGATWQVRRVPDGVESQGVLPEDWRTWPRG